jgi:hypothetical protein
MYRVSATIWSPFYAITQSDGTREITALLVNVKQATKMPSIDRTTREKIRKYVEECTAPRKNWETNADSICYLIEGAKIIGEKDIVYADDGTIAKIRGTEVRDGVLLLKEKKKPLKVTEMKDNEPIPFIQDLRARRKVVVL